MTRHLSAALTATAIAIALALPAAATAAAPEAPAWKLTLAAVPANLAPGATVEYQLIATNVGGAPSSGAEATTIEAAFPPELTPVAVEARLAGPGSPPSPTCAIAAPVVTCASTHPLAPGRFATVTVEAEVALAASGTLEAQASVGGGGAPPVTRAISAPVSSAPVPFDFLPGIAGVSAPLNNADGSAATQAGSHPYQLTFDFGVPSENPGDSKETLTGAGHLRDLLAELPRGLVVNPTATPALCTEAELISATNGANCPAASQIGSVLVTTSVGNGPSIVGGNLYNMVPPPGAASSFGFEVLGGIFPHIVGSVRSDGDYGLSGASRDIIALGQNPIFNIQVQLWGSPSAEAHDAVRGACFEDILGACPVERTATALLTMPGDCPGQSTSTVARADSWEEPGVFHKASYESADLAGNEVSISGCNQLEFEPTIQVQPTTNVADSPSGLDVVVHQPQDEEFETLSPAIMKDIALTLPEGMAVNPSSAEGLGACTEAEAKVNSLQASECPDAAKIGSVEVTTPLLGHPLPGALYVAEPFHNPSGSLIAIYLAIHDPEAGVIANLAGEVSADPSSGQLTSSFAQNPELPIEDIHVQLFKGPRASLRTPVACATYVSSAQLVPWSAPETASAHPSDSFAISSAPGGGACPSSPAQAPNSPSFQAGTFSPQAGAYSPFYLKLTREDGSQAPAGIEATLPPGLSGKLAGIAACSDAEIARAKAREKPDGGRAEIADPSCPAPSEVGSVDVAAGAGPTPLHVEGHAYLAGPYKGAPLSLAIVTPAVAGPFDLGAVVVRAALRLDPETAQIHATSDPIPEILEGIPLDVRSIEMRMARPKFTLNPTSCDPFAIAGVLTSTLGQSAALKSPFQVGGCQPLPFKPKLSLRLKGGTRRAGHPELIATLAAKPGEAGIASASVQLPRSAFLDQAHIRTVCTRVQFAANACPSGSIYGTAAASTPLLDYPLAGNVYLRSSNHKLPDLVVALKGPASQPIEIDLAGKTDSVKGALRNTFEGLPDAPVSSFRLELFGGKRGLVVNSRDLCARRYRATIELEGHNGKAYDTRPVMKSDCGGHDGGRDRGRR